MGRREEYPLGSRPPSFIRNANKNANDWSKKHARFTGSCSLMGITIRYNVGISLISGLRAQFSSDVLRDASAVMDFQIIGESVNLSRPPLRLCSNFKLTLLNL